MTDIDEISIAESLASVRGAMQAAGSAIRDFGIVLGVAMAKIIEGADAESILLENLELRQEIERLRYLLNIERDGEDCAAFDSVALDRTANGEVIDE